MIRLERVPSGLKEIVAYYGDPDIDGDFVIDPGWKEKHLTVFNLPYPLRLSWRPETLVSRVTAHRLVGDAMMDALVEIGDYRGGAYLEQNQYNYFGGIFNPRMKRGIGQLSTHTWGIAIDINPHLGPLGKPSQMPEFIVNAFVRRGFVWGGEWKRTDAQHMQAAKDY